MGIKHIFWGVISPEKIKEMEYDYIIISLPKYAEEIKKDLLNNYSVLAEKIIVFNPVYMDIVWEDERVLMLRKLVNTIKERNILGNIAEVGVYKGAFSRIMNFLLPDRNLFLFDTFEGFDGNRDFINERDKDSFKDTSIEQVMNIMPYPESCIVKKGYFPDTAIGIDDRFCIVSLDCDLYEPIIAGLDFFYPRLNPGGYIIVHDFGSFYYTGVKKAVLEYCEREGIPFFPIVDQYSSVILGK